MIKINMQWCRHFCLMISMLLAACNEEEKYIFKEVNELQIANLPTASSIEQGEILKISPKIIESITGSGPYSYEWDIYRNRDLNTSEVSDYFPITTKTTLSKDKDLDVVVNVSPGDYFVQYVVLDQKFNVKTTVRFPLVVNATYYEGWLVLNKNTDRSDISLIREDEKVFHQLIKKSNPDLKLKGESVATFAAIHKNLEEISYFTTDSAYFFNANDLKFAGSSYNRFDSKNKLTGIKSPFHVVHVDNFDQYIINNGGVYGAIAPNYQGGGPYSERMNGPANYSVFPLLITGKSFGVMFYDNHNKFFLYTNIANRVFKKFEFNPNPAASFDVSKVNKDMIAGGKGPSNEYFLLMKDSQNTFFIYSILPNLKSPAGIVSSASGILAIDKAKHFDFSEINRQMYYTVDNKIYIYDILGNSSKLIYEFPATKQIKDLKVFKGQGWGKADPLFNKRLVVATNDGVEGEVYYFDLEPIGDISNGTFTKKFTGFGEIEQIVYRHPNI